MPVAEIAIVHDAVRNWIDSAVYDLETAEAMFVSGRYIYTVFMCHLALEKILKAKVEKTTSKTPPRTHDLEWLIELAELSPEDPTETFLAEISASSVVTRYSDDFGRLQKDYSKQSVEQILNRTKEVFQWIKGSVKP